MIELRSRSFVAVLLVLLGVPAAHSQSGLSPRITAAPQPAVAPRIAASPQAGAPPLVAAPAQAETPQSVAPSPTPGDAVSAPQNALPPLNLVPSAAEELGRVPNHFVWLRPGLQMMQDPVDAQLVFVDDDGRVVGRAALPPQYRIGDVVCEAEQVRLIELSGQEQVIVSRAIDPGAVTSFQASAVKNGGSKRLARLFRTGPQQLQLQPDEAGRSAGAAPINIRSIMGGALAQAYEIGPGSGEHRYVVSEEIGGATPGLRVRAFAQRFDRAGHVTGIAHLPLDDMDVVPRDFVTVTDAGALRVLVPTRSGVTIREIQFSQPLFINSQAGKPSDSDFRSLGEVAREFPVDSNIMKPGERSDSPPQGARFRFRAATPPITRERALSNARAYLTVNWVLKPENYSKAQIENRCEPAQAKFWLRPARFNPAVVGKTIGPMPYRWGGDDTPESFRLRVEWGALAGDVCTCRQPSLDYCLVQESAGVDCSGFVSKAWGIEKRGTSGLLDVATELGNIAELRPGDAFVRPGNHVRLLTALDSGAGVSYTVLESTTSLRCEGVCESTYRPSELNGYRLIRYRGMTN